MLWQARLTAQSLVLHAPPDSGRGGVSVPNRQAEKPIQDGARPGGRAALGTYTDTVDSEVWKTQQNKAKDASRRAARHALHRAQRAAAKLIRKFVRQDHRITKCKWVKCADKVRLLVNTYGEGDQTVRRASYKGLVICGNVWGCPVCGARISRIRRAEMNVLLAWARAEGLVPILLTLTARHGRSDSLEHLLHGMKEAKRRLRQRAEWRRLPFEGSVTATEITHGVGHGWHPHFHELILLRAENEEEALGMAGTLRSPWLASLRAYGLDGASAAFDVRGAAEAGNYVTKWGVAEEMTLTGDKAGKTKDGHQRGRLPAELATLGGEGDATAAKLWVEYFEATSGKRRNQLVWSKGLKLKCGVEEVSDEEAAFKEAEDEDTTEYAGEWDGEDWRPLQSKRVRLMDAAEEGGAAAVKLAEWGPSDLGGDGDREADLIDGDDFRTATEREKEMDEFLELVDRLYEPSAGVLVEQVLAAVKPPP